MSARVEETAALVDEASVEAADTAGAAPPPRRCWSWGSSHRRRKHGQLAKLVTNWAHASGTLPPMNAHPLPLLPKAPTPPRPTAPAAAAA